MITLEITLTRKTRLVASSHAIQRGSETITFIRDENALCRCRSLFRSPRPPLSHLTSHIHCVLLNVGHMERNHPILLSELFSRLIAIDNYVILKSKCVVGKCKYQKIQTYQGGKDFADKKIKHQAQTIHCASSIAIKVFWAPPKAKLIFLTCTRSKWHKKRNHQIGCSSRTPDNEVSNIYSLLTEPMLLCIESSIVNC